MAYIHTEDPGMDAFIRKHLQNRNSLHTICEDLFTWFDENVTYSRLNAPYFPLQRSDVDVLSMKSGTCGDYSNFLVSIFLRLGYEARYAYVRRDCYGNEQDHICAAVKENEAWILVDATLPYRKWHGFCCPHQEYELLTPAAFEERMKKEEAHWTNVALHYGNVLYAGLLYAPWIHEEIIAQSEKTLESVFYLLLLDKEKKFTLYAYLLCYTKENGTIPMMCILTEETRKYCFSIKKPHSLWDNDQWSQEYPEADIPKPWKTEAWHAFHTCIARNVPNIQESLLPLKSLSFCQ